MKTIALLLLLASTVRPAISFAAGPAQERPVTDHPVRQIRIPTGSYIVGDDQEADNRLRRKSFASFWIDIHPVTNAQFQRFLDESGYSCQGGFSPEYCRRFPDHPATGVALVDAEAFARYCGKRLPTEWEWEIAARSLKKENVYATGSPPSLTTGNFFRFKEKNGIVKVCSYPPNAIGLYGMAGNVFEWTSSRYTGEKLRGRHQSGHRLMVLRGSAWTNIHHDARATKRTPFPAARSLPWLGFRCVSDQARGEGR
jgi:formylglycine-generating enzyme required for sulfatase activity